MSKDNGTKLSVEQWDIKVSLEIPNSDTTLPELFELYKGATLALGYSEINWKRTICELAADYMDEDIENGDIMVDFSDDEIDAALAEHNMHEEGWSDELEEQFWKEQPPQPFATPEELEKLEKDGI